MKAEFWLVGKNKDAWVADASDHYLNRCSRYCNCSTEIIPESRHRREEEIVADESSRLLQKMQKSPKAFIILLDEHGKQLRSTQFSELLAKQQDAGNNTFRFIIGGAYGVSDEVKKEVDYILALSAMTFPHQLVRVIFLEQLYRAFTILRGEGYHHE